MKFISRHWEWIAGVFVAASIIWWAIGALVTFGIHDRYTATDAEQDRAIIEKKIEALQEIIIEEVKGE